MAGLCLHLGFSTSLSPTSPQAPERQRLQTPHSSRSSAPLPVTLFQERPCHASEACESSPSSPWLASGGCVSSARRTLPVLPLPRGPGTGPIPPRTCPPEERARHEHSVGTSGFISPAWKGKARQAPDGTADRSYMAAGSMDTSGRGPGRGRALRRRGPDHVQVGSRLEKGPGLTDAACGCSAAPGRWR